MQKTPRSSLAGETHCERVLSTAVGERWFVGYVGQCSRFLLLLRYPYIQTSPVVRLVHNGTTEMIAHVYRVPR